MEARKRTPSRINRSSVLVATAILSVIGYLFYIFYPAAVHEYTIPLPSVLAKSLNVFVDSSPSFVAIQVAPMNLSRNLKYAAYTYIKEPEIQKMYSAFTQSSISPTVPIFTNESEQSNMRTIRIINHEFVCTPYDSTTAYKYLPLAKKYISTVCSASIPTSYGDFRGSLTLYLSVAPDEAEKDVIRIALRAIAERIYIDMR